MHQLGRKGLECPGSEGELGLLAPSKALEARLPIQCSSGPHRGHHRRHASACADHQARPDVYQSQLRPHRTGCKWNRQGQKVRTSTLTTKTLAMKLQPSLLAVGRILSQATGGDDQDHDLLIWQFLKFEVVH
eukprot:Skav206559  [mRNA]  locus=scaffold925:49219:49624:- [translate_table: standard]